MKIWLDSFIQFKCTFLSSVHKNSRHDNYKNEVAFKLRIDQTIYRSLDAKEIPETPNQTNEGLNIFKKTNHSSMDDCLEITFVVAKLAKHSWQACTMCG